ncbi:MAG: hypothetical protein J6M17_01590 [Ruminococcus sp.]|nr:hypothetical protein [Ruminococcus sp.]
MDKENGSYKMLTVIAFMFIGVIMIMLILGSGIRNRRADSRCSATCMGYVTKVTEISVSLGGIERTAYHTNVGFDVDGTQYELSVNASREYRIGAELEVHYDPSDPDINYVVSAPMRHFYGYVIVLVMIFAMFGILLFRWKDD